MLAEKSFKISICFSLLIHIAFFLKMPKLTLPAPKALNEIEITYKILKEIIKEESFEGLEKREAAM